MEQDTIVWYGEQPLRLYGIVADKFGLSRGSRIQDSNLFTQVVEENIKVNRAMTGIKPPENGEVCGSCSG